LQEQYCIVCLDIYVRTLSIICLNFNPIQIKIPLSSSAAANWWLNTQQQSSFFTQLELRNTLPVLVAIFVHSVRQRAAVHPGKWIPIVGTACINETQLTF
jgi:hypothetical protein